MKKRQTRRARYVQEGANDFAAALTVRDCPYPKNTELWDWWLHGWWGAYYKERDRRIDAGELCGSCSKGLDNLTTGIYVVGKHGTTKTVCGDCKTDLVQWDDYQVMAQAKSLSLR
jgi:hypothetical protein